MILIPWELDSLLAKKCLGKYYCFHLLAAYIIVALSCWRHIGIDTWDFFRTTFNMQLRPLSMTNSHIHVGEYDICYVWFKVEGDMAV